jgi:tetratricopeptide (TPR) repeat protein
MKSRNIVTPAGGRVPLFQSVSVAGLTCFLVLLNQLPAHADALKATPWAAVMPGPALEELHSGQTDAARSAAARRAAALALYYKARRLEQETDDPSALAVYLEAAALDPAHPTLNQRIIGIYSRTGRLNEALGLLEKTVARFPQDPAPLLGLARPEGPRPSHRRGSRRQIPRLHGRGRPPRPVPPG